MKKFAMTFLCVFSMMFVAPAAQAAFQLPNYAQGQADLKVQMETKGKKITDIITYGVGIISIIVLAVGGFFIGAAQPERGKLFILSGMGGIIIAGAIYGIAALVA